MLTAKIVVTVKYHKNSTMEHAEEDKAEFLAEIRQKYWPNVSNSDIHIDYSIVEVVEPTHSQEHALDVCALCAPHRCFGHP